MAEVDEIILDGPNEEASKRLEEIIKKLEGEQKEINRPE